VPVISAVFHCGTIVCEEIREGKAVLLDPSVLEVRNQEECSGLDLGVHHRQTAPTQEEKMVLLSRFRAAAAALTFMISPALAQTATTPAPTTPPPNPGVPPDMNSQTSDSMREMMREMMQEMMQEELRPQGRRGDRAERRDGDRWRHHARRDRPGQPDDYGMGRRHGGMRSGMMHGAGMRMVFAIVDADGDGALSLAEVQDFHGRIFNAVDENGDGSVELKEIESFFHGSSDEAAE
jgi:hypothetical protein